MSHPDDRDPATSPAEERTASSAPLQEGAAELRAATEAALKEGEVPHDPAGPHPGPG